MICEEMFRLKKNGEPVKNRCYCRHPELIENYDKAMADDTQVWDCHHRFEILGFTNKQLKNMGMYYDVEPKDLIFLTHDEHAALHMKDKPAWNKGKKCPQISEAHKGMKHSEERNKKISDTMKGKTSNVKGKHWKLVEGKRCYY